MAKDDVIRLLNEAMVAEHQAILQYNLSAWALASAGLESDIQDIARDEMRHFKYFAHGVRSLGGEPDMTRPSFFRSAVPTEMIRANVAAEVGAIEMYRQHRSLIPSEHGPIIELYDRVIGDEQYHEGQFEGMLPKVEGVPPIQYHEPATPREAALFRFLEEDMSGEYGLLLRFLHQSFMVDDGWLADGLHDRATEQMKHLGWLAEEKVDAGGEPELMHGPVTYAAGLPAVLQGNPQLERQAQARYQRHIDEYDDPELQRLWAHIKFHQAHYLEDFVRRSAQPPAAQVPVPPSVGSLFRKPQSE